MRPYNLIWLILLFFDVSATIVGSNIAISRNSHVTFPENDFLSPNEIRGFALMDGGFTLQNSNTECLFTGLFPIRTQMNLNGGTFNLSEDLILENIAVWDNLGDIRSVSGLHTIMFPSTLTTIGDAGDSNVYTFEDIEIHLKSDITVEGKLSFEGDNKIIGFNKVLNMGDGELVVASNSQLLLQDIVLTGIQGTNIRCEDDTAILILSNVHWYQRDNTYFSNGMLTLKDMVEFSGTSTFVYDSPISSVVNADSEWRFSNDILFELGRHPVSSAEPILFEDRSSILAFDDCNFIVTDQGVNFTKGTLKFLRTVSFELVGTNSQVGLMVGDGVDPDNDFAIIFSPASILNFNRGHFVYNCVNDIGLQSKVNSSRLIRSADSYLYQYQSHVISKITVENLTTTVPPIIVGSGVDLFFEDVILHTPTFSINLTGKSYTSVVTLLQGAGNYISILKGSVPLGVVILNTGNLIEGNGTYAGPIIFLSPTANATWSVNGALNNSCTLNGGTLILGKNLILNESGNIIGPGTVSLSAKTIYLPLFDKTYTTPLVFSGSGTLECRSLVDLNTTWNISNSVELDGRGHTIDLTDGAIVVGSNSKLTIKDATIQGLSGTNLRCADNTGSIVLNNCNNILSDDYSFGNGGLQFKNNTKFSGDGYIFAYETSMTSTILADSTVLFDTGLTFSYDPSISPASTSLFEFANRSSELMLKAATIVSTATGIGLPFTKGMIRVLETSFLKSPEFLDENNNFITKGITFGNGNSDEDIQIVVDSGAYLQCTEGTMKYKNMLSSSLKMANNTAAFYFTSGSQFRLYESVNVNPGLVIFEDNAEFFTAMGKVLTGSIIPHGNLLRFSFTPV